MPKSQRKRPNTPLFDPSLWRLWRGGAGEASLPGKEPQGQFIGRHMFTRRVLGELNLCLTRAQNKENKRGYGRDLFFGVCCEGVLDAEDDVGSGAAAGALLQELSAL